MISPALAAAAVRRIMIGSRGAACAGLVGTALVLASCGGTSASPSGTTTAGGKPVRGGTLTLAVSQEPLTMDPTLCVCDPGTEQEVPQVFDTLVEAPVGPYTGPAPGLADSWSRSPDGLTYTFHLRRARFSNGDPVTSADVAFTFRLLLNPNTPLAQLYGFIKSVTAPDPSTAVFHLAHPLPSFYAWLTMVVGSIIPEKYYKEVGMKGFESRPLGAGPFKLTSWQHGQQMVLARNPYYWKPGRPFFDMFVVNFVPYDNARVLDVRSGAVDIANDIPFSQLPSIQQQAGYRLLIQQDGTESPVFLNEQYKPLKDPKVRLALNYATPKATINRVVYDGKAVIENSSIPILSEWDSSIPPFPYDIAKARQLMAQSGYATGFPLSVIILGSDTTAQEEVAILTQAWARIGVHVTVKPQSFSTLSTNFGNSTFQALMESGSSVDNTDLPSDSELAYEVIPGPQHSLFQYYNDSKVTALVNRATTSTGSEAAVKSLYTQLEWATHADPPWVYLVYVPARTAVKADIGGFGYTAADWWRLDEVYRTG